MTDLLAGRRILVVEDEMLVLMNVVTVLEELGCSVICTAASVTQALLLLAEHEFDAAVLDVNLRGELSYPVADALRQRGIPFAFSTGYGDHGERFDFDDRPLLRKPYPRAAFIGVVEHLMAEPFAVA